ncbi:energy-coupling factor transporter transmembrane protein EcfT [Kaistia dalseonensis]|uniref:Biotin transport system permease protein n=1 Tax=Kaistia dalseonensis TaxID=410840 RepID=A0ABU0HB10_9HYPH|nr:energy-coupling factor transporter transmembrane protein EcfT [Kaistia dalseonensis]MCX5496882.1 energy-coupling factor transporter transmembrane protein EcfT [Kaistia dalseonensis]MDQ0439508.1 biotin transport system permease protein [Kaistia dalseonensis]
MTIGLYQPGHSALHRLPAGAKLAGLLVVSLALFLIPSTALALLSVPVAFAVYLSTGAPFRRLIAELRGPAVLLLIIFAFHAIFGSIADGVLTVARFATLILLASAITHATPISEMAALVEWLLSPLRPLGVNPEKVGLAIALAIRFIPLIAEELRHIREAQAARGLAANPLALFVPLIIRTLKAADELADAIEARGYDG